VRNLFYIVSFCAVLCGLLIPQLALFSPSIPYLIGLMLFINFLEIRTDPGKLFRKELLVTVPLSAFIMPLFAYYVLSRDFIVEYRIGLFLAAIAPSGIIMLILSRFVQHKDYNLIISNFFATQFGVILYLPFMVRWILGAEVNIDVVHLFFQTAALILTPYAGSIIVKRIFNQKAIESAINIGNNALLLLIFLIISSSIGAAAHELVWDVGLLKLFGFVISIYLIQGCVGFIFGTVLRSKDIRNSLALTTSSRNIQLVLGLAIINFPPLAIVPLVLGIISHHLSNALWLWLLRK